jgi:hypothetical protein
MSREIQTKGKRMRTDIHRKSEINQLKEIILIEYRTVEELKEILQWLEENTDFVWAKGVGKPTKYAPRFGTYNVLLLKDNYLSHYYTRTTKQGLLKMFKYFYSGTNNILTFAEAKDKILNCRIEKEDDNKGMVYNPITKTWNWGF